MRKLKSIILRLPFPILKVLYHIYDCFAYPELKETYKTYGSKNSNITFYVIRPITNSNEGLMSLLLNVCRHIIYAEKNNYVPVVDFKNYKTQYSDGSQRNIWEDYFEQISNYSLEEVYESKNVILSGLSPIREETFEPQVRFSDEQIALARSIISKYIHLKPHVIEIVDREYERISAVGLIGLYLRGTDYVGTKPIGHFVQPTFDDVKYDIDDILLNTQTHKVFLVTEDNNIYSEVRNYYNDKLEIVSFDSFISEYNGNELLYKSNSINEIAKNKYERGLYYLVKIIVLSKCNYLYGGNTCGSWAAVAFSQDSLVPKIYNLGIYK